ncbi:ABC transporter permease [Fulvivirga lutimaris]|uniref:ABC transporter permease n=1 Tax=Fulvivirga lutimaris TaxID=1819566 RepID=UPI0012BD6890|nr:ABC transporter permease [Fulvivirga lutimaris]MTI41984.1 ABC transporter permease [Fulvivirga lutimaris]
MLKNYIKIAIRTLRRKSVFALINVVGLSSGLLCVVFIFNWVQNELSYDRHIRNSQNIYRVAAEAGTGDDKWHQSVTSLPLGPSMRDTYANIVAQARLDKNNALVSRGEVKYIEDYIILTDPEFFNVFDYHLLKGNEKNALSNPYQIVLTETIADKYFAGEDPLGKTLKIHQYDPNGKGVDYTVTGVIADPPHNSHFTFNMLGSISTIESVNPEAMTRWMNNSYHTYVKLKDGTNPKDIEAQLPDLIQLNMGEEMEEYDLSYRFYLQPITDIHLHSDIQYEFRANGNIELVWVFGAIGMLILTLACVNYINLSTAFSLDRVREVGVRKVLGAHKSQLVKQHFAETIILVLISILLCGLMIEIVKPVFYSITGKTDIKFDLTTILLQLFSICIPLVLIAGYFPAKILANVNTVSSLKGKVNKSNTSALRSGLVVFQFSVTLFIIISLIVVQQQLNFVQSKDLGYDKNNLLVLAVNGSEEVISNFDAFKNTLITTPEIQSVARSNSMIVGGLGNVNGRIINEKGEKQFEKLYRLRIDYDYFNTYGIQLLSGRNFSLDHPTDYTQSYIINESTAKAFNWDVQEAIGKELTLGGNTGNIIGVTKNFHYNSLHHEIEPLCLTLPHSYFSRITIKGNNSQQLLKEVEHAWQKHFPEELFDYRFQDDALFYNYENDLRFGQIFNVFAILSLLISFLGLFGLIGFNIQKRTKEIGIRKVLGSSSTQIIQLVSKRYLKLILIAAVFAIPLAALSMNEWLATFSYRTTMEVWYFIYALVIVLAFAFVIVLVRAFKPALTNPANILKEE